VIPEYVCDVYYRTFKVINAYHNYVYYVISFVVIDDNIVS